MLERVFLKVIDMSIEAAIVILIVMLARLLLKKFPKMFSYVLWIAVLFRLLSPVSFVSGISPIPDFREDFREYVRSRGAKEINGDVLADAGTSAGEYSDTASQGIDVPGEKPADGYEPGGQEADGCAPGERPADGYAPGEQAAEGYAPGEQAADGYGSGERPAEGYAPGERPADGYGSGERPAEGYVPRERPAEGYAPGERPADGYAPGERPADGYAPGMRPAEGLEAGADAPDVETSAQTALPAIETGKTMEVLRQSLFWRLILSGKYVWIVGCAFMLSAGVISALRVRRRMAPSVPLRENIYITDERISPFVMGVLNPRIYLPNGLNPKEQEYIILHEQCHIRRLDYVWRLAAYAALCIHWFNPLVWLAFFLSGNDMEMSCDEAVIRRLGEAIRADYAESLLNLSVAERIVRGIPLGFGESTAKGRIKNLAAFQRTKKSIRIVLSIAAAALILCLMSDRGKAAGADTRSGAQSPAGGQGNSAQDGTVHGADEEHAAAPDDPQNSQGGAGDDVTEQDTSAHAWYEGILKLYYRTITETEYDENGNKEYFGLPYYMIRPIWSWNDKSRITERVLTGEGYALRDLDGDGTDELLLGWTTDADERNMEHGYVYAVYALVGQEAVPVLEGNERSGYVLGADGYLYNRNDISAGRTVYTKYRFNPDYERLLEPLEQLRESRSEYVEAQWEYAADAEDIDIFSYGPVNERLRADAKMAAGIADAWMHSGESVDYVLFSDLARIFPDLQKGTPAGLLYEPGERTVWIDLAQHYIRKTGNMGNFYQIDENQVLWGSGYNQYGQLGQGIQEGYEDYHTEKVKIAEHVIHVDYAESGDSMFVIYLTQDHKLYGMGYNGRGELQGCEEFVWKSIGNDPADCVTAPRLLMENVAYARCGRNDVVCMTLDGAVYTWGTVYAQGHYPYLADYAFIGRPEKILEHAVLVTGGLFNHAALLEDGTVWTWGYNLCGNCGISEARNIAEPTLAASDAVMVWTDRTMPPQQNGMPDQKELALAWAGELAFDTDRNDITEFFGGNAFPTHLLNTVIQKTDGSYWVCGEHVGTQKKTVRFMESVEETICSAEFQQMEARQTRRVRFTGPPVMRDETADEEEKAQITEMLSKLPEEMFRKAGMEPDRSSIG